MANTTCGWCGRLTHMTLAGEVYRVPTPYSYQSSGHQRYAAAFRCDNEACESLSIGVGELHLSSIKVPLQEAFAKTDNLTWTPQRILRPSFPDVPEQIADTAAEAHACLSVQAYRGAVALARAVVEATAKDKGIVKGSLAQKIDKLHEEGHIRPITQQVAHEVREGGNEIAHGDLGDEPMPAEDATAIIRLMDEILHEVYQGPAAMLRLKKSREEREERNKA
ncbi:DUF4145 domain-containing protein [Streptomyces sp. NPDC088731]|uniref:DUF4145 domain-containing protein n=1 Tax=Streptomyces sp. NPDC088731 TaxID=3365878 RepID=UPI0038232FF1